MAVRRSSSTSETAQKFADFMGKVRQGDLELSNEEILKFSKAFRDSLMLDNLEKQQLMAICKILNIRPIGNTNLLRFQIKLKMRNIKADDLMIKQEGAISSLEVSDLQSLVRERGKGSNECRCVVLVYTIVLVSLTSVRLKIGYFYFLVNIDSLEHWFFASK